MEDEILLYACCPKCCKPIGRSKRIDGLELNCPKCGSPLRVTVGEDAKVLVEMVHKPPSTEKKNRTAAAQ